LLTSKDDSDGMGKWCWFTLLNHNPDEFFALSERRQSKDHSLPRLLYKSRILTINTAAIEKMQRDRGGAK